MECSFNGPAYRLTVAEARNRYRRQALSPSPVVRSLSQTYIASLARPPCRDRSPSSVTRPAQNFGRVPPAPAAPPSSLGKPAAVPVTQTGRALKLFTGLRRCHPSDLFHATAHANAPVQSPAAQPIQARRVPAISLSQ